MADASTDDSSEDADEKTGRLDKLLDATLALLDFV